MTYSTLAEHYLEGQNTKMSNLDLSTTHATSELIRRVLVIDDDDLVPASLRLALPANWSISACDSPEAALALKSLGSLTAVFVDMHLSGDLKKSEGLEVLRHLKSLNPQLEFVAMSGDLDIKLMEQGLECGATRFLAKPIGSEEFLQTLEKIEALALLKEAQRIRPDEPRWVGKSEQSLKTLRSIASLKGENGPILIEGESGTGKEVAAWLIHRQEAALGSRPFIRVNLGAIPENIFESEMFGHVKGAFTGADQNKIGLAEAANGGDLFLDEIEALPLSSQAKLLRFLESGEIRKVGARDTIKTTVRVIAATNRDLSEMVKNQEFREDLMWRVSGKRLKLPALRDRLEDTEELATYFLSLERPRRNKTLAADAVAVLKQHRWDGNVRELKRLCEQVCLVSPLPIVRAQDVLLALPQSAISAPTSLTSHSDLSLGLVELTARFEAAVVREAVTRWPDLDVAAEKIGISRSSMYKKMKDYGIERI